MDTDEKLPWSAAEQRSEGKEGKNIVLFQEIIDWKCDRNLLTL
jgi:hypothetical protein